MRQAFLTYQEIREGKQMSATTYRRAMRKEMPWAAVIIHSEGGFLAFESVTDWEAWKYHARRA
jgi:hypothetical protein